MLSLNRGAANVLLGRATSNSTWTINRERRVARDGDLSSGKRRETKRGITPRSSGGGRLLTIVRTELRATDAILRFFRHALRELEKGEEKLLNIDT